MTMILITFLILALSGICIAEQASNFNVSAQTAAKYECEGKCYRTFEAANAADLYILGDDYDPEFYATATNFSGSDPGDLLKLEFIDPSTLNIVGGVDTYRFQYTSLDVNGSPVPVTGFITIPCDYVNGTVHRTIAFAHGTLGVFHGCAPSATPTLYDYQSWSLLAEAGYAIIATDYSGLGSNASDHKWCTFPEHAFDLFFSVVAARKAFGAVLSKEWMSVGHSQGGGAVWKLAELEAKLSDRFEAPGQYLGTVALSPATRLFDMAMQGKEILDNVGHHAFLELFDGFLSQLPWLAIGLDRLIPFANYSLLGPVMKTRIHLDELSQACNYASMALTFDLKLHELVSFSQTGLAYLEGFQNLTAPANGGVSTQPIMVVQGMNDTSVLPPTTKLAWEISCEDGSEVYLWGYNDMGHTSVIGASASEWMNWIAARFDGKAPATGKCTEDVVG